MSSRPEHPTHTTGAHRSRGPAPRRPDEQDRGIRRNRDTQRRHEARQDRYEPYLDGLFTYCLSVLCEHDAATAVLGEALALAERQHGRCPGDAGLYGPWLYALARWACLRRLAEAGQEPAAPPGEGPEQEQERRRELAVLAWPEAAGTTPEQREALELSVRHRLSPDEVAAVLGAEPAATRALLAAASCEVERTRAALAVVEFGRCPDVGRLAGDSQMLLGAALRRELVRHVDDCAECRRTAERATAAGPWPGTAPADQGALPLVGAEHEAVFAALAAALKSRSGRAEGVPGATAAAAGGRHGGANGSPRYGRNGFPVGPTDRVARRRRLRSRALTTTVVATVLAAPVLALWAAYRGAPETGETDATTVAANGTEADPDAAARFDGRRYENAGNARPTTPRRGMTAGDWTPDVSVEVAGPDSGPTPPADREERGPGRLTVDAQPAAGTTVITIRASGRSPVRWRAAAAAPWLQMSHTAGELQPGQTTKITVYVDHDREPEGHWKSKIAIEPGGTVVALEGRGVTEPAPGPGRPSPGGPTPAPPHPAPGPGRPTPTQQPAPSPTPTYPGPTANPTARPTQDATGRPTTQAGGPGPSAPGGPVPSHTPRPPR
ncbi:RNA polymerase sigma factor [Streptomyces sp. GS7]|uniref:RNA polymerase sigma factor n=1 Tax=Streptomyces sp. GS7 TaxID=2692234 RepID=UPI001318223F|nr:sigma-70 family RNA polymerase sigma factor [Streptomyces sp. GS7]QHC26124.1 sigma-70 family RNA polymerase sigma factor [Streptomyces sp. GS7]